MIKSFRRHLPRWILAGSIFLARALLPDSGAAGEYYISRDAAGMPVLSNIKPTENARIVEHYQLDDVTDEQVRIAEKRDQTLWLGLELERLAESYDNLAAEVYAGNVAARQPIEVLVGTAVGVPARFGFPGTFPRVPQRPHRPAPRNGVK